MPIEFRCNQCQHLLRVPDESVGGRARCPQCGSVQPVVSASAANPFISNSASATPSPTTNAFADLPPANPYYAPAGPSPTIALLTFDQAKSRVLGPAIAMIVVAVLGAALVGLGMFAGIVSVIEDGAEADDIGAFVMLGVCLLMQVVVVIGSLRMIAMKNYALSMAAAIFSMLCGLGSCLSLPFGIWALVVLVDTQVKSHFR